MPQMGQLDDRRSSRPKGKVERDSDVSWRTGDSRLAGERRAHLT